MKRLKLVILFLLTLTGSRMYGQQATVYVFDLKEEVGPSAWRTTRKAFAEAKELSARLIVMNVNTFGGMVDYADSIRTKILHSEIPVIAFINNNAASAGALISIAANRIYMVKGASVGAASVVNPKGEIMPEKYQSYMRGLMRATAEARGRDPRIAEAFVDPDIEIPGIIGKGKVLTLTSREAVKVGYCKAEVTDLGGLLAFEGLAGATIVSQHTTILDNLISFLINPAVSGILILLIIGGIYFEMQSPGIGFALLVSIVAALLYFAPLYLEGLAAHWEIALFFVGVLLLLLAVFVIPGFGVAGILGILFVIAGLTLSMLLNNWFDFSITAPERFARALSIVLGAMIGSVILSVLFGRSILRSPVFQRLVLKDEQKSQLGYVSGRQALNLLHKTGTAMTDMRPSGKVEIDGKWFDAIATDGYIVKGSKIRVEKLENYNVFVRKKIV